MIRAQYFYNQKDQNYNLIPFPDNLPFEVLKPIELSAYLIQQSAIGEHQINAGAKYLGNKGSSDYQFNIEYAYQQQYFNSNILFLDEKGASRVIDPFLNKNYLYAQDFELGLQNRNTWGKLILLYKLRFHYKTFLYEDTLILSKRNSSFVLSPLFGIAYESSQTKMSLVYSSDGRYPTIEDLYSGYIFTDYRTLSQGAYHGDLIRTQAVLASFIYQDFGRQLMFYSLLTYLTQNKTFGSKILIDPYFTLLEKTIVPGNKNLIFSTAFNKFLPFLYSTIKLEFQLSNMTYYNYVNGPERRNSNMVSGEYGMELNSGWKRLFNFHAGIRYRFYRAALESASVVSETKNMTAHLNLIINPGKKLRVIVGNEQFFFDIRTRNARAYYFLDVKVKYTVAPNKFSIQFIGNNLLDKTTFDRMSVSDYLVQTTQYNILPRQILLNVTFRF